MLSFAWLACPLFFDDFSFSWFSFFFLSFYPSFFPSFYLLTFWTLLNLFSLSLHILNAKNKNASVVKSWFLKKLLQEQFVRLKWSFVGKERNAFLNTNQTENIIHDLKTLLFKYYNDNSDVKWNIFTSLNFNCVYIIQYMFYITFDETAFFCMFYLIRSSLII